MRRFMASQPADEHSSENHISIDVAQNRQYDPQSQGAYGFGGSQLFNSTQEGTQRSDANNQSRLRRNISLNLSESPLDLPPEFTQIFSALTNSRSIGGHQVIPNVPVNLQTLPHDQNADNNTGPVHFGGHLQPNQAGTGVAPAAPPGVAPNLAPFGGVTVQPGHRPTTLASVAVQSGPTALPFILLLLAKNLYEHRLGIGITIVFFAVFTIGNKLIISEVASKERRSRSKVFMLLMFLVSAISLTYYLLQEERLYMGLAFQLPSVPRFDLWTLLWVVGVNDFMIKLSSMALKSVVILTPPKLIPFKRRGTYLKFIEECSCYYRLLIPIRPWTAFLLDNEFSHMIFCVLLLVLYLVFKGYWLVSSTKLFFTYLATMSSDFGHGTVPSEQDLANAGDMCPICHDSFSDPISLKCRHVFCEECLTQWFARENTCPLCRAPVETNGRFRNGCTSSDLAWF